MEIPVIEFAAALDECAAAVLWEAGVGTPPVDARRVAEQVGLVVAGDGRLTGRARFAKLTKTHAQQSPLGTIVVGPAERREREQWAIAHEIGESVAWRVFERLDVRPQDALPHGREDVANQLANRLLLPQEWFNSDGNEVDWDLYALKKRYATASHELIARRMLDMTLPIVVTVFDHGRETWRRSNIGLAAPRIHQQEVAPWKRTHTSGLPQAIRLDTTMGLERVRCWPVHEPGWKREIVRSEICEQ